MRAAPVPQKDGPRANRDIRGVREVQLIDEGGTIALDDEVDGIQQRSAEPGVDGADAVFVIGDVWHAGGP